MDDVIVGKPWSVVANRRYPLAWLAGTAGWYLAKDGGSVPYAERLRHLDADSIDAVRDWVVASGHPAAELIAPYVF